MPNQMKDGVGRGDGLDKVPPSPASHRRSAARRRIFRDLIHIAAEQGATIEMGISTAQALQECLDRAVALLRFAAQQVDNLAWPPGYDPHDADALSLGDLPPEQDPMWVVVVNDQGPDQIRPHRYVTMEREARLEVEKLAAMMTQLGVAERVVRVEEAKAALMVAAVREAAMEAGFDHDAIRLLGAALRKRIEHGLDHQSNSRIMDGRLPATDPSLQYRGPSRGTVAEGRRVADVMGAAEIVVEARDLPTEPQPEPDADS